MDLQLLKSYMVRKGLTAKDMAEACGISTGSWFNKTQGRSSFTVREAIRIKQVLNLNNSQISEIFFAD